MLLTLSFCSFLLVDLVVYLLQIILAFGNYMNSSKRGGVYGFKVASLDMVRLLATQTESL